MTHFKTDQEVLDELSTSMRINKSTINKVLKGLFRTCIFDLLSQPEEARVLSTRIPYFGELVFIKHPDKQEIDSFITLKDELKSKVEGAGDKDLLAEYCEKYFSKELGIKSEEK